MKRAAIALLLGLSGFAVQAQPPAEAPQEVQPVDEATTVITAADAAEPNKARCVRETGTRLAKRDRDGCTGAPGDSYSREEIDRTGAVTTADAIRKLSPRASVQRGN